MNIGLKTGLMTTIQSLVFGMLLAAAGITSAVADGLEPEATGFEINNALSGTWYNPDRSGEGFMLDIGSAGRLAVSFYTYDNYGNQMWLVGPGNVDGSVAVVDLFVTEGGLYGSAFDKDLVSEYHWGSAVFTFTACATGSVDILPDEEFLAEFEVMSTAITRLTVPVNCD